MKSSRVKLKDYIELYDEINKANEFTSLDSLQGINKEKFFQECHSNKNEIDLTRYRICRKGMFAYNKATSRNGEKISIAYRESDDCLISPSYICFYIKDESVLMHEYLMLLFRNPTFDKYVRFHSWGSATEFFTWESMCDVEIQLPSIKEQKAIVNKFNKIKERISFVEKEICEISKLLDLLFMQKFGFIFKELTTYFKTPNYKIDLPSNYKFGQASDFYEITIGKTPPREVEEYFTEDVDDILWYSIADMNVSSPLLGDSSEKLTEEAVEQCTVKLVPENSVLLSFKMTVGRVAINPKICTTNEAIAHFRKPGKLLYYTYLFLRNYDYDALGSTSSITTAINSKIIKAMPFIIPCFDDVDEFNQRVGGMFDRVDYLTKEIEALNRLYLLMIENI